MPVPSQINVTFSVSLCVAFLGGVIILGGSVEDK